MRIGGAQSSVSTVYGALTGIAFTDDEQIIGHLDRFIQRVRSMIDIIETLKQLNDLVVSTRGLPIFSSTERSMTKPQSKSFEIVGHVTDKQAENELAELKEHDEEARTDDDEEIETVLTGKLARLS